MSKCLLFDTNAFLDLYAFKKETTEDIFNAIKQLDFEIKVLPQVYQEFLNNYKQSRSQTGTRNPLYLFEENFKREKQKLDNIIPKLKYNNLSQKYNTSIDYTIDAFSLKLEGLKENIQIEIERLKNELSFDYTDESDIVKEFIDSYYDASLELTIKEKLELIKEFDLRIKLNIKPGLTDLLKEKGNKYGDMFIWYDILKLGGLYDEIYFIQNERKSDWWEQENTKNIDPVLEKEYLENNPNSKLVMINLEEFCKNYLYDNMNAESIQEVGNLCEELNSVLFAEEYIKYYEDILRDYNYINSVLEAKVLSKTLNGGLISCIMDFEIIEDEINRYSINEFLIKKEIEVGAAGTTEIECDVEVYYNKESIDYFRIKFKLFFDLKMNFAIGINKNKVVISPVNCNRKCVEIGEFEIVENIDPFI